MLRKSVLLPGLVWLIALPLLTISGQTLQSKPRARPADDSVIIRPRRVVLIRLSKIAKQFPARKRATVTYPNLSGLRDRQVLRRVQSILNIKNIFDYSLNEYRQDPWLTEFTYQVKHNNDYILDIAFTQSGVAAYPDTQTRHFTIDLKAGAVIKPSEVILTSRLKSLAAMVNDKLQAELRQMAQETKAAGNLDPEEAKSVIEAFEALRFEVENLAEFSVSRTGITFVYDAGFPYVIRAFSPRGEYFFSYAELKPYIKRDGLLGQFVN